MTIILSALLALVALLLLALLLGFAFYIVDAFLDLPYVATQRIKIDTIIKLAQITKGETVVDLGSGDGRLLIAAASAGAHAIGYEINPYLVLFTKLRAKLKGLSENVTVKSQNLWKADLKIADAIFVYGRKSSMQKFEDFVYKNTRKGTRVIVNSDKTIPFPNKKPLKSQSGIFLYKV